MSVHHPRATATRPCTGCGGGVLEHYVLFGFDPAKLGVNKFKLGCNSGVTRVLSTCDPDVKRMLPACLLGVTFVHHLCNLGVIFALPACYCTHLGCNPGVTGL